jgi:hypothetical protein
MSENQANGSAAPNAVEMTSRVVAAMGRASSR